jgi:taurine dioxygenase
MKSVPLTDHFGVELHDFALTEPIEGSRLDTLREAFDQGVVLIRGTELADRDQDRLARALGELHVYPWGTSEEIMSNVVPNSQSVSGSRRLLFHVDGIYGEHVAPGTCLWALEVSPTSPPTVFADSVRAYETLSPELQARIEDLHGVNTFDIEAAKKDTDPVRLRMADHPADEGLADVRTAIHPVVVTVPHTDHRAVFVNEFNTSHILEFGPDSAEGEQLLQELFGALYDESNLYTHHYQNGDVVIWNNIAVQHARPERIDRNPRSFRRLVISSISW